MNQQKAKAIRRKVRQSAEDIIYESLRETCKRPLRVRLKVAWRILWKQV